jgi:hypothetical protein
MTFELEADGVRIWCSSPFWTRKLVERGIRLVDASQAPLLSDAAAVCEEPEDREPESPRA